VVEAVDLVASGRARPVAQDASQATFQGLVDDAAARLDFAKPAVELDRWIRGCDPQPGAHAKLRGETLRLFDGRLLPSGAADEPPGTVVKLDAGGAQIAARGGYLEVKRVRIGEGGKKLPPLEAGLRLKDRLA
jgi:methionyl-tRNA formyltransferase